MLRLNLTEIAEVEKMLNKRFRDGTLSSDVLDDLNLFFWRRTGNPRFRKKGLNSKFEDAVQSVSLKSDDDG